MPLPKGLPQAGDIIGPPEEQLSVEPPPMEAPSAVEPPPDVPLLTEPLAEDVIAAEPPPPVASPVLQTPVIHADATIRGWFSDTFNNLIATGRVREREAEAYLQDLLKRLGL